jgi:tetratricopeptide (TPR) repeat protein
VFKTLVPWFWMLALATLSLFSQNPPASSAPALPTGVVIPKQTCAAKPEQSYALYLPSQYAPDKRWPIVYAFDPDGRGNVPVELMKDAADRYGYIVVGSNNSRNGSWKVEGDAAQAMWDDTHARLAIDDRRLYFAGFSGGARVASILAQRCKCAAGVLLSGAGFGGAPPSSDAVFAVFAAVGSFDFNYPELSELDGKLEQAGFAHVLRHFDGPHEWAPAEVMDEALAWFRLMAMKQDREAKRQAFIAAEKMKATARAHGLEESGESYEAWREYKQAVATFTALADTASLQQAATALAQQKSVREGAKREAQDFEEQKRLTAEIYSGLVALKNNGKNGSSTSPGDQPSGLRNGSQPSQGDTQNRSDIFHQTDQQIVELRQRTTSEKNVEKLRVDRRALSGVFIAAGEFGDESLEAKNYAAAKSYFQLAVDANPDSVGALKELAMARALDGDRKGAMEALRRAKEKAKDAAAFVAWVNEEPAFAKMREDAQFRALVGSP